MEHPEQQHADQADALPAGDTPAPSASNGNGSVDDYVRRYAAMLDRFVAAGFVLPRDRDGVIETARRQFTRA